MAEKRLTIEEAAEKLGKSRRTLERWKAKGADGFELIAGIIFVDVDALLVWRGNRAKTQSKNFTHTTPMTSDSADKSVVASSKDGDNCSFQEARRRKELAMARKHEFDLELKKGEYLHRDQLLDMMNQIRQTLKAKLTAQASRLCARFADIEDARELHMEWDQEQWEILNSLSEEFGVIVE